ncbi:MAG: hypothetical protein IJO56_07870 [Oscillospiraceae bacterium]|nr:hypothetical protein [Bacteroidales bacterium]MBQ9839386.1 hypothetical protein [Oscillospiraceae bacterium]
MICDEMRPNPHKKYVDVIALHRLDGAVIPLRFRAEDEPAQRIQKVLDMTPAPALKAGGQGMRYTCLLECGTMMYLFHDRSLWFYED